jgi:hypothetical protein
VDKEKKSVVERKKNDEPIEQKTHPNLRHPVRIRLSYTIPTKVRPNDVQRREVRQGDGDQEIED